MGFSFMSSGGKYCWEYTCDTCGELIKDSNLVVRRYSHNPGRVIPDVHFHHEGKCDTRKGDWPTLSSYRQWLHKNRKSSVKYAKKGTRLIMDLPE